ncbi:MAG: hypothetical protein AAGB22_08025 [Bacteroidota bacterium]
MDHPNNATSSSLADLEIERLSSTGESSCFVREGDQLEGQPERKGIGISSSSKTNESRLASPPFAPAELPHPSIGFAVCGASPIYVAGLAGIHGIGGFHLAGVCLDLQCLGQKLKTAAATVIFADLDYPIPGLAEMMEHWTPNHQLKKLIGFCETPGECMQWKAAGIRLLLPKSLDVAGVLLRTKAHCKTHSQSSSQ